MNDEQKIIPDMRRTFLKVTGMAFLGTMLNGFSNWTGMARSAWNPGARNSGVAEPKPGTFTFAFMTDTHCNMKGSVDNIYLMSQWIADHSQRLKIRFAGHLGDVGDRRGSGPLLEMLQKSRRALQPLIESDVPFSLAIGNHDYRDDQYEESGPNMRSAGAWNRKDVFGRDIYAGQSGYGGSFEDHNPNHTISHPGGTANHYFIQNIEGNPFLFLTLEFFPRTEVMEWADRLVTEDYPDHTVIVLTHAYLSRTSEIATENYGGTSEGPGYSNSGMDLWNNYFSRWKNLRFIINGHYIDEPRQAYLRQTGIHGNRVNAHFFNYQNWAVQEAADSMREAADSMSESANSMSEAADSNGYRLTNIRRGGPHQATAVKLFNVDLAENKVSMWTYWPSLDAQVEPADPATHPFK